MRLKGTKSWSPWIGRTQTALLSVVVVGGLVAYWLPLPLGRRNGGSELRELAAAVGPHRVTRARLTGGFVHVPCDTAMPNDSLVVGLLCRAAPASDWAQSGRVAKVATTLRASTAGGDSSRREHVAGVWHVLWGVDDAAVDELRGAARLSPTDAGIQSDLAAALLAQAERTQDPRWILDAYNAVDSALVLDPRRPEARFNRALTLEWLGLRPDAIAAWSAFLEVDARSSWANEARSHLKRLRASRPAWQTVRGSLRAAIAAGNDSAIRTIAAQYPVGVRGEARRAMIDWAHAQESRVVPQADTLLGQCVRVSRALAAVTGDSLWLDAGESLTPPNGSSAGRSAVARGILAYERGDAYLGRTELDSAERYFRESEGILRGANNAAQFWATLGWAQAAYARQKPSDYQRALRMVRTLRATAPNAYPIVRGLAVRMEALIDGVQANFPAAIAAYLTAIEEGRGTGDPGLELRPHANIAGNYGSLGDDRAAWVHLYGALRSTERYGDATSDVQRVIARSADRSARRSPQLSLVFQGEAISLASQLKATTATDSVVMVSALRRQAELLAGQGRPREALESVRKAREHLAKIHSDSLVAISSADLDLVAGQAWLNLAPDSAVQVLRPVVQRYRDTQYFLRAAVAELLLANAYVATGAMGLAQQSFETALAEVERRRSAIAGPEDRARFLDQARPVIDALVRLLADRGDTLKALEFLEQMRGRVLLERVREDSSYAHAPDLTIEAVSHTLPARTSIVSYALLKGEVLAWVIHRDGISMHRIPVASDLEDLTSRFARLLTSQPAGVETRAAASQLYRLLIAPIADHVTRDERLVIVPDKWLQFVPFAALFDSTSHRFLVQQLETVVTPSVQLYAKSAARYDELRRTPSRTILAVGNPSFDGRVFSLARLPGAEREAKNVASFYDRAQLLVGANATKKAFLNAAQGSNVIHFAGHGVARADAPLLSYLVLAADSSDASTSLSAQELFARHLPVTRLAILSGCQTADGRLSETEGVSSLARAFFAAGVPAVVASLWPVDDEATADFFRDYHRALSKGEDPSTALRETQLEWIGKNKNGWNGASTWAAFTLFGATTGRAR